MRAMLGATAAGGADIIASTCPGQEPVFRGTAAATTFPFLS
jgi:hypothetical protein